MYYYASSLPFLSFDSFVAGSIDGGDRGDLISADDFFRVCALCAEQGSGGQSDVDVIASARLEPPGAGSVAVEAGATSADFGTVPPEAVPTSTSAQHPIIERYWNFERRLRNELLRLRSEHLARRAEPVADADGREGGIYAGLRESLSAAFKLETPLHSDIEIDRLRWQFLNELEAPYYFRIENMIVYYLRLQILWRRAGLSRERGMEKYNEQFKKLYSGPSAEPSQNISKNTGQ